MTKALSANWENILERLEAANSWMQEMQNPKERTCILMEEWYRRRPGSIYAAAGDLIKALRASLTAQEDSIARLRKVMENRDRANRAYERVMAEAKE